VGINLDLCRETHPYQRQEDDLDVTGDQGSYGPDDGNPAKWDPARLVIRNV
jgi:hypothetical protein